MPGELGFVLVSTHDHLGLEDRRGEAGIVRAHAVVYFCQRVSTLAIDDL